MRRLPLLELLMAAVVAVTAVEIAHTRSEARRICDRELEAFAMMGRLDRSGPLPPGLEPVAGTVARRHGGYYFVGYLPGPDGTRTVDVAEALSAGGPYLAFAWPVEYARTARRIFMLRSPGFILESENDVRPFSGLPPPPCPWAAVAEPAGNPMDPEEGTPEDWLFTRASKQRPRLQALGVRWSETLLRQEPGD